MPGPGGLKLEFSPGTESIQMDFQVSHWMMAVNQAQNKKYPVLPVKGRVAKVVDKIGSRITAKSSH